MPYSDLDFFDVAVDDNVAVVRLNRPEAGNAYSAESHTQMSLLYPRLAADDAVHSAVITGAGEVFCIGPDREFAAALNDDPDVADRGMEEARRMIVGALDCPKPIVSAINGRVVGGGLAFTLCTDIIIADRDVELREIHIPAAVTAGDGGVLYWPMAMGLVRAKRYVLTGDPLSAEDAAEFGLITEAVEAGTALERAMTYARRFAQGPQNALRTTKKAMNHLVRHSAMEALELSVGLEAASMRDPEASAAMADLVRGGSGAMQPDEPPGAPRS